MSPLVIRLLLFALGRLARRHAARRRYAGYDGYSWEGR